MKSNKWYEGNFIFDDDWDLHEYDQKIYFASEHNIGKASASVEAKVGVGYKDGKISGDYGFSINAEVIFGNHGINRANNQLTRSSILATNVNDMGSGLKDGFAIRRYGIVELVFNFYYVNLD